MNVLEAASHLGITPQQLFQNAYQRYGLMYGLGPPDITFPRWEKYRYVPAYVFRYCKDAARRTSAEQPLLI